MLAKQSRPWSGSSGRKTTFILDFHLHGSLARFCTSVKFQCWGTNCTLCWTCLIPFFWGTMGGWNIHCHIVITWDCLTHLEQWELWKALASSDFICLKDISMQLLPSTLWVSACSPAKRPENGSTVNVVWNTTLGCVCQIYWMIL